MFTKLSPVTPVFEGLPRINAPEAYGASTGKPLIFRVPAFGQRPLSFSGRLPKGLSISRDGIITGSVKRAGEYKMKIRAENALGSDEMTVKLIIGRGALLQTPLIGWTSWNAFLHAYDQNTITDTAHALIETGLSEFGYSYVNIDSDWQGSYGGKYDAIQPNERFTDMKAMTDHIHSLGLKCGIYSTPMKLAFGMCQTLPGCTRGETDGKYLAYREIGKERMEQNNVDQWVEWGFDYLKYDWYPNDTENAAVMAKCLRKAPRDIVYCVTTTAVYDERDWYKNNTQMFRIGGDSEDSWEVVRRNNFEMDHWLGEGKIGGWADLDMLEIGYFARKRCRLTDDEQVVSYTAKVIFPSPIQLSCDLRKLTETEMRIFCNEEVIAVNQDVLGAQASLLYEANDGGDRFKIYEKRLSDGGRALALFNIGEKDHTHTLEADGQLRDLWAKEDIAVKDGKYTVTMPPHTALLLKIKS